VFIYPINHDELPARVPWVVVTLMGVNTLLFLTYCFADKQTLFMHYGFIPAQPRVVTLFSSMFLHAGFMHLLGNMWFLWMFGVRVENTLGSLAFVLLYLTSGFAGSELHYAFNMTSSLPCVGASGAISGVVGAYFVLFPRSLFDLNIGFPGYGVMTTLQTRTHAAVGAWIGEQLLLGLFSQLAHFSSVAFWAHVGGFAGGLPFALAFLALHPRFFSEGLDFSVPAEALLPVRNVKSMRRWYKRLRFVEAPISQESQNHGGVLALKAGGELILFRLAGVQDMPITLLMTAPDLDKARATLRSRGVPASALWFDRQNNQCLSFHDPEGNTIKVIQEKKSSPAAACSVG
jgi:membrane associated rhomboid family serine protease